MSTPGLRVALFGATGMLGRELLATLGRQRFPVNELVAVAGERSLGESVELRDGPVLVEQDWPALADFDLVFVCTPPEVARDVVRQALRAETFCIDLSAGLAGAEEIPVWAGEATASEVPGAPAVRVARGMAIAWSRVLRPLQQAFGLRAVQGVALESVSTAGRAGLEALHQETASVLNQQELPLGDAFEWPIAFDCHPGEGVLDASGASQPENTLRQDVLRILTSDAGTLALDATLLRIPTFTGEGAALRVETESACPLPEVARLLGKAPGVELQEAELGALRTRAATGRTHVVSGRLREASGCAHGVQLWLAADALTLAATSAVELAEARLVATDASATAKH